VARAFNFQTARRLQNEFALAAQAPEVLLLASAFSNQRAQGMPGADAPAAKKCTVVTTVTPESPGIPRAMVLRLTSCSPRRSGSFATVTSGIASTGLTPASRCQDHTTWPSVATSPVSRAATSTASRPDVRDVRETPLWVERDARDIDSSRATGQEEYFLRRGWTRFNDLPVGQIKQPVRQHIGRHTPPPGLAFGEPDHRLRRSLIRGMPRGLFGKNDSMAAHSKSYRMIQRSGLGA
jgi:hypothetical protein